MNVSASFQRRSEEVSFPLETPDLRSVMRQVAGSVSIVTAGRGDDITGATVTSATALSVEPATMIVNINLASSTLPVIEQYGHFCVNILDAAQVTSAERFSGKGGVRGRDRYEGAKWEVLATGAPVLTASLASIDCEVEEIIRRHSHAIVLGRVMGISGKGGTPLLYSQGRYQTTSPEK